MLNDRPYRSLDSLPEDTPAELRRLDAQLHDVAQSDDVPAGMSVRVYDASVMYLPARQRTKAQPRLRLVGTGRVQRLLPSRMTLGRLAMAASVAIVCSVAIWFVPSQPTGEYNVALSNDTASVSSLTAELEALPISHVSALEDEVAHLIDTSDLRSFDEITGDLANAVAMLER